MTGGALAVHFSRARCGASRLNFRRVSAKIALAVEMVCLAIVNRYRFVPRLVSHRPDAVRAIRAGLEITAAVSNLNASAPMHTRVGIHTGLVVVGETGQGDASIPKAAVGNTPNIAARLQALADPALYW